MTRTVWLSSYPKSGNTWVRAIVSALRTHPHLFGVDHLGSGSQPFFVGSALGVLGLNARWLARDEIDTLRDDLIRRVSSHPGEQPILRKTHELYRPGPHGREPFPTEATRAAIYLVRDPRDVACSYAPFFGVTIDEAIEVMARGAGGDRSRPSRASTAQPWGSWSTHAQSWLADDVPFPVHLVRYEDLLVDAVATLAPVFDAIDLGCAAEELSDAVAQAAFERLRESEQRRGFRETSPKTDTFFRKGAAGSWRSELTPAQVEAIEADHGETMTRLGYELQSDPTARAALAASRQSRQRLAERGPWDIPAHLQLSVTQGQAPCELPGSTRARPWLEATPSEALVRFSDDCRLWVRDGRDIVIDWDVDHAEDDASWIVNGWGITLAMLQRGMLSLHAVTVQVGDEVVAVAGNRGAGKSTTAMALRARGHRLLCDDVTIIEFRGDEAWTTPFSRNVHLLEDAAAAVGVDARALPVLAGGRTKVAFRAEEPPEVPHRIDRIVVLTLDRRPEAPSTVDITHPVGAHRVACLLQHVRRDGVAPIVLGQDRFFEQVARLAQSVPIALVRRPVAPWTLDAVVDLVEVKA